MFYVGDILWMEKVEYPPSQSFSGYLRFFNGDIYSFVEGDFQSLQDPITGQWQPACIFVSGLKFWYDKGLLQSLQDPQTQEWMPAVIGFNGRREWWDKGKKVLSPKEYEWSQE